MNFNKNEFGYRSACAKHKDEGALAHTRTEFGGSPPVIRLGRRPAGPNPTRGTRAVVVLRTTLRLARNRVLTPPFGGCFINYVIVRRQRSTRSGYDLRARPNGWPEGREGVQAFYSYILRSLRRPEGEAPIPEAAFGEVTFRSHYY